MIHNYMETLLIQEDIDAVLDKIYVCTSRKEQNDPNMKPNPGMIVQACQDFNVSPRDCVFIGDTFTDLQAATSAKVPFKVLVSTGYGKSIIGRDAPLDGAEIITHLSQGSSTPHSIPPFYFARNLASAVSFLLLSMGTDSHDN
jgi:histidinol phosphatase-like enzyme